MLLGGVHVKNCLGNISFSVENYKNYGQNVIHNKHQQEEMPEGKYHKQHKRTKVHTYVRTWQTIEVYILNSSVNLMFLSWIVWIVVRIKLKTKEFTRECHRRLN